MDGDEATVRDVGKLWGAIEGTKGSIDTFKAWAEGKVREFEVVLIGVAGDNGLRGNIKTLAAEQAATRKKVGILEDRIRENEVHVQHLWEVDRPAQCLGIAEVNKLRAEIQVDIKAKEEQAKREREEMRRLRWALWGALLASLLTVIGSVLTAYITMKGPKGGTP